MTSAKEDQHPLIYICLTEGDDCGPRIRAWTTDPARAEQLRADGLNMVEYRKEVPMTTCEELVALADILDRIAPGDGPAAVCAGDRRIISNALRLASRQEVSVTVEELATLIIDCWKSGKAPRQVARALIAKYFMTKRTTEG